MLYSGSLAPRYIGLAWLIGQTLKPDLAFRGYQWPSSTSHRPTTGSTEPAARKDSSGENFPVASRLLPKRLRPHVMAYYKFVRLADDIADDPDLEPELKLSHSRRAGARPDEGRGP